MTTTRRAFLEYSGGLAIAFIAGRALAVMPGKGQASATAPGFDPNVFVHVATDGWVTLVCHRSEMGQGVRSTLPALLADEMGADMARVKIAQADGDKKYGDQKTDGSSSIRNGYDDLRRAGATARSMLVAAAARRWNVSPSSCEARDHAVFHGKRSLGFGELAAELEIFEECGVSREDAIVAGTRSGAVETRCWVMRPSRHSTSLPPASARAAPGCATCPPVPSCTAPASSPPSSPSRVMIRNPRLPSPA